MECPWHFHELVGATLSAFRGHVLGRVGDRTAWPNSRETEQEEEEAGQLTPLQKDKSFVVLKIRSHSADPTFHSSGTELFQDAEWEGQRLRLCSESCGGQKRAEGPWRTGQDHQQGGLSRQSRGLSPQGRLWG